MDKVPRSHWKLPSLFLLNAQVDLKGGREPFGARDLHKLCPLPGVHADVGPCREAYISMRAANG